MKRYFFTLICSLPLALPIHSETITASSSNLESITIKEWLHGAKALDKEYQNKLIIFLDSMSSLLSQNNKDQREAIEKTMSKAISHTKDQIKKIKKFMHLTSHQKDSFSLQEAMQSINSEGSNRLHTSLALQEIMIDDPALLKMIKQIDNSTQHASTEHIADTVEEEERFLQVIERFQKVIHNNFENPVEICSFLKKEITNSPFYQVNVSDSEKDSSTLWDSIVKAFKIHY